MYVCVYLCVCVCVCLCMYVCAYVCMYVCVCTYLYIYTGRSRTTAAAVCSAIRRRLSARPRCPAGKRQEAEEEEEEAAAAAADFPPPPPPPHTLSSLFTFRVIHTRRHITTSTKLSQPPCHMPEALRTPRAGLRREGIGVGAGREGGRVGGREGGGGRGGAWRTTRSQQCVHSEK